MKTLKLIEKYLYELNEQDATMPDPNATAPGPAAVPPGPTDTPPPPGDESGTKTLTSQGEVVLLRLLKKALLLDIDDDTKTLVDKIGDINPDTAAEAKDVLTKIIGMEDIDEIEEPGQNIQ